MSVRQVAAQLVGVRRQPGEVEDITPPSDLVGRKVATTEQHLPRALAAVQMQAQEHILERGHLLEERGELKRAHEPARGDLMRAEAGDVLAVEDDRPAGRSQKSAQEIEAGRLAGAVRADQADDLALVDGEVDAVDGRQPAEEPGEIARLEERHEVRPPDSAWATRRSATT